jgi:hypothetical protein
VQRFGLRLVRLLPVLGRHHLPLAAQDLSTLMAQTFSHAVVGPAALTHIRVGVRVQVRMPAPLDLVSLFGRFVMLVVTHRSSVTPSSRSPLGPKVQR